MDFVSAFSFLTGFGCGYVLLECVYRFFNFLGFFLIFGFCFKILRFGWHVKNLMLFRCDSGGIPRIHLCVEKDPVPEAPEPKVEMARGDPVKSPAQNPNSPTKKSSFKGGKAHSEDGSENENSVVDVDEVFDVTSLRRLVKMERRKANAAWSDLEKERTAAASSAEEAMAMILRLQNEKSSAEIQANQFRRMADERLEYDQELIEELQWEITQHETQKDLLEDQLEIYREELKVFVRDEEINDDGDGDGDGGGGDGDVDVDGYGYGYDYDYDAGGIGDGGDGNGGGDCGDGGSGGDYGDGGGSGGDSGDEDDDGGSGGDYGDGDDDDGGSGSGSGSGGYGDGDDDGGSGGDYVDGDDDGGSGGGDYGDGDDDGGSGGDYGDGDDEGGSGGDYGDGGDDGGDCGDGDGDGSGGDDDQMDDRHSVHT